MVRAPILRVAVTGPSMDPTLRDGEWWLVLRTSRIRPGDLVVVEQPERPGLLVVKRAIRLQPDGWWIEGDNPAASRDSRAFGAVAVERVLGRLWWRYRPWPPASVHSVTR